MRVEDGNIDPAGWYTGPQNLYPADDPYQTVAQLEMARPWTGLSQSLNSRSQSMARSTSQSSLAVRSAARTELARSPFEHQFTSSRPATPTSMSDLISPASHSMETPLARSSAMLAGPAREVLRRNPDPTWITVPGSRQAPAVGKPGPGCRKGRGGAMYDMKYRPAMPRPASEVAAFGSLTRNSSSLGNALYTTTLNSTMSSLASSGSSDRALRLEAAASRRRPKVSVQQPVQRVSTPQAEPWMTAPGIGFGGKFYYRP